MKHYAVFLRSTKIYDNVLTATYSSGTLDVSSHSDSPPIERMEGYLYPRREIQRLQSHFTDTNPLQPPPTPYDRTLNPSEKKKLYIRLSLEENTACITAPELDETLILRRRGSLWFATHKNNYSVCRLVLSLTPTPLPDTLSPPPTPTQP